MRRYLASQSATCQVHTEITVSIHAKLVLSCLPKTFSQSDTLSMHVSTTVWPKSLPPPKKKEEFLSRKDSRA